MLKCKIDRAKGTVRVSTKGNLDDITVEVLGIFQAIHKEIAKQNPIAAKEFKNKVIGVMLDPRSPVWKEDA